MSWFYLALLAPLLFAIVVLIDDNLLRFIYRGPYLASAISGVFGALPLVSLFFVHNLSIQTPFAVIMVLAGFLTTLYYFFYFRCLERESPSIVIAMLSLVPATLPLLAYFLLDERLLGIQIVGFVLVLVASLGLALTSVRKFKFSRALLPVLVVVVLLDIISLLTKYVYEHVDFYPAYMYFAGGMGLGGVYFSLIIYFDKVKHDFSFIKRNVYKVVPLLIGVELIGIAAEFTSNLAISRGPVSLVRAIEGIQPMYILLIALALYPLWPKHFREAAEGKLAKKFAFMSVIVIGLLLISSK